MSSGIDSSFRNYLKLIKHAQKDPNGVVNLYLFSNSQYDMYSDILSGKLLLDFTKQIEFTIKTSKKVKIYFIVHWPGWAPLAIELKNKLKGLLIYDCMDHHFGFSNVNPLIERDEIDLLKESDFVSTTSQLLQDKARKYNNNCAMIQNATDYFHFNDSPPNGELGFLIDYPIIGYHGAINDWFDFELMERCSQRYTDYNFVLIGGTDHPDFVSFRNRLAKFRNIHLLGEIPYHSLPGYIAYFNVCLIPFKINQLTNSTNPVKFYEYLSTGKPIVTVNLPELEPFKDYCYWSRDSDEFTDNIEIALNEQEKDIKSGNRKRLAQENTWDIRFNNFKSLIEKLS